MKRNFTIISTVLAALILMAFVYTRKSSMPSTPANEVATSTNFIYNLGHRFNTTVTKEDLQKAVSIIDIVPEEANWAAYEFKEVSIKLLDNSSKEVESINTPVLNPDQRQLLNSTSHSESFRILATAKSKKSSCVGVGPIELAYYMTIVPDKQAVYQHGHEKFISYVRENSNEAIAHVQADKLQPGKILFTISTDGTISNVELSSSSGYPEVDEKIVELITHAPGTWEPAVNSNGLKVKQQLMFSFGIIGC